VFFGGARGGGKTDGVLGKWALKERRYGVAFNAVALRRTTISAEDAIERSKEIYGPLGGRFREHPPRWRMPNGGRVSFGYLESVQDANEYQGRNVTDLWIEEAGQFPTAAPIDRMFGVLRSSHGVPIQLILTANPGGAGQHWLKERYKLHPFPLRPLVLRRILPNGKEHRVAVIPSRITDNRILLDSDPDYVSRLYLVGSAQLVKAWLEGDWSAVEGAFFSEWSNEQHVIAPFAIPDVWLRFRSGDWGSYAPFSIGWWAVVGDDYCLAGGIVLPRGALVRYREWYGSVGGKLTADQVGQGVVERERTDSGKLTYGVMDPAAFTEDGGPSIAERINDELFKAQLAAFIKADNRRVQRDGDPAKAGPMGGWDQVRARLIGTAKRRDDGAIDWTTGRPMLYTFATCGDSIRTIPVLQHDPNRAEDLDTTAEDHCADEWRYASMSRPWIKSVPKDENLRRDAYRSSDDDRDDTNSVLVL
jgi:Phage terminase large subunit